MSHTLNMLRILTDPRIVLPALREFRQREGRRCTGAKRGSRWLAATARRDTVSPPMASRGTADAASRPMGHRLLSAAFSGDGLRPLFRAEAHGRRLMPHSAALALTTDVPPIAGIAV